MTDLPFLCVLQHKLQLSDKQKGTVFLLRRAHLQHQALLLRQKQELQLELGAIAVSHGLYSSGQADAVQLQRQIQNVEDQMQEVYFTYKGTIVDGVSGHETCSRATLSAQCTQEAILLLEQIAVWG